MKLADAHIHCKVMKLPAGYGDFSGAAVNGGTGGGNPRFDGEFYTFFCKKYLTGPALCGIIHYKLRTA